VEDAYGELDARGRALAIDVAASHDGCVEAAPLLARGLCESAGEAPRKAREKLERCKGAAGVLAARMVQDARSRRCLAPTLVTLAGPDALEPLADAMALTGEGEQDVRATLRTAFADALGAAPRERLVALLGDTRRSALARVEMMRAAGPRVLEAIEQSDATMAEAFAGSPTMRTRYVALGPLGELARGGDATAATRLAEAMQHDVDWPVRARAAELGAGVASAQAALVMASRDPEPRVREAALQALSASTPPPPAGIEAAQVALRADGWPFVRAQALGVLARAPATTDVSDALRAALGDASSRVRGATLVAVSLRRTVALRGAVRERLDHDDDMEVRAAAARALGSLCDMSSADRLTELAHGLGAPGTPEEEQPLALAALVGLAALQPPDLRDRLGPLLSNRAPASVRKAAQRALEARSVCR
jgi:HEAT repeat protein